jgi:flagellar motor component MotA
MDNQTQTQINLNDIKPEQSIQVLYQLMNKANKAGVFTIDESYSIKILLEKLAIELKLPSQ